MIYTEDSTLIVGLHKQCTAGVAFVRGKFRCDRCGHRLTVNGVEPIESRKLPIRTWHLELIDRRRAIAYGRGIAGRDSAGSRQADQQAGRAEAGV